MPEIFNASGNNSQQNSSHSSISQPSTPQPVSGVTPEREEKEPPKESIFDSVKGRAQNQRKKHVDEYSEVMRQEEPSTNPFDAYAAKPVKVFFDSQLHDEEVILLLRRHPITQLKWVLVALGLVFMPFLFSYIGILAFLPAKYQFFSLVGWYLLIIGFSLESFLNWFFNSYVITDERVIDIDFDSLIYKNISAAKIDNIEDITATTGGAIQSIFDFGTIKVQTAAEKREFEFEDVPHPARVTTLLNELLMEEEREKIEGRVN